MPEKYKAPEYRVPVFNCPHCGVASAHKWALNITGSFEMLGQHTMKGYHASTCLNCGKFAVWHSEQLVFPIKSLSDKG